MITLSLLNLWFLRWDPKEAGIIDQKVNLKFEFFFNKKNMKSWTLVWSPCHNIRNGSCYGVSTSWTRLRSQHSARKYRGSHGWHGSSSQTGGRSYLELVVVFSFCYSTTFSVNVRMWTAATAYLLFNSTKRFQSLFSISFCLNGGVWHFKASSAHRADIARMTEHMKANGRWISRVLLHWWYVKCDIRSISC